MIVLDPADSGVTVFPYGWLAVWLDAAEQHPIGPEINFPGLYAWIDPIPGTLLYVGQSGSIGRRLRQHFQHRERASVFMWRRGEWMCKRLAFYVTPVSNRAVRLTQERGLIRRYRPTYNRTI